MRGGGSSRGNALDHRFWAQVGAISISAQGRTQTWSEAAVRLMARSKGADEAHSAWPARAKVLGRVPASVFLPISPVLRALSSGSSARFTALCPRTGGKGWGSPGWGLGQRPGPAQCISAACWWAWGAEERTSRVLSGLCIRFEWWLFLFGTCQPPGQLPAAREGTAWPGVLMYVLPGINVCVCVCANAHVYAQGGGGASREEPLSACPQ